MKNLPCLAFIYFMLYILCVPAFAQKKGKLTLTEKETLKTARVMLYRFKAPPLNFMTPKDAAGAGLIADVTRSDIGDKQQAYDYDPTLYVQKHLDSMLRVSGLMTNIESVKEAFDFQMPSKLKDLSKYENTDADYIVEIITPLMSWQASYSPTRWRRYSLNLGVEIRIIRKSDWTMIWRKTVGYGGLKDDRLKFMITELEENGKEKISKMRDIAALECSKRIVAEYITAKK